MMNSCLIYCKHAVRIHCAVEAKQRGLKMKLTYFIVLLFGCTNGRPNPAKRSSPTCPDFPKQLSGRLYEVMELDSGSSYTTDMQFNLDSDLQMMQAEAAINDTDPVNMVMDYKGGKTYVIYSEGCYIEPLTHQILSPEEFKHMSYDVSGELGSKGTLVDLYSLSDDGTTGMVTLEAGNQCIPVSYATQSSASASTGSFLDLKTTADTGKMKIPEHCEQQISRRHMPATIRSAYIKEVARRGLWPWIEAQLNSQRRGYP